MNDITDLTQLDYWDALEPIAIFAMGVALMILARRLYKRGVLRLPSAVALAIAGLFAFAWKYPDMIIIPDELALPFKTAEVQFFVSLSIAMTLFALDVFTVQARALVRAEETLRRQAAELEKAAVIQQMAAIIESSEEAIIGQGLDGSILSWNTSAERIFGYRATEAQGRELASLVDPSSHEPFESAFHDALSGTKVGSLEIVCVRANQTLFDATMTLSPIRDATGAITGVSCIARDVTELKRSEELRKLALSDELTGLNNRRGFMALAEHQAEVAQATGKPFTLLFIDLNGLKQINDNLGHKEGDRAIADAAAILRETFRDTDILARVGGDEFCVLLTEVKSPAEDSSIPRLQTRLDIHNLQSERPFKVALSVGAAEYDPKHPCSITELMQRADESMYRQKLTEKKRHRLMICDDDPSICSLIEVLFSDDYDVFPALTGKDALRIAQIERPDLILMDLNLPDMTGTEAAKQLRESPLTKLTPIIMITGAGGSDSEIESLRAGVDDYVEKPFDEDALRVRMENILKRARRR